MTKTDGLRFAPLIRVSTEGQEKKGENRKGYRDSEEGRAIIQKLEPCAAYRVQQTATSAASTKRRWDK